MRFIFYEFLLPMVKPLFGKKHNFEKIPHTPPLAQAPLLKHVTALSIPLGACATWKNERERGKM